MQQNTYAFLIKIIKGADYPGTAEVETIALHNESCPYNFISARFARSLRIPGCDVGDDIDGDISLVWVCEALGRYHQRSVFWIIQGVDWDLLFGFEEDYNTPENRDNQFQCGINNGSLKMEYPRKSFQVGIEDDYLLPVGHSKGAYQYRIGAGIRMPTLADIKIQLAAPLTSSLERRQKHDKLRVMSTLTVDSSDTDRSDATGAVIVAKARSLPDDASVKQTVISGRDILGQSEASISKGTKRGHAEQHTVGLKETMEDRPRSPKIRNGKSACSCRCIAGDPQSGKTPSEVMAAKHDVDLPNTNVEWGNKDSESALSLIVRDHAIHNQGSEDSGGVVESTYPSRRSTTSTEDDLLFAGMERAPSPCDQSISCESSSISLMSNESSITPNLKESVTTLAAGCDQKSPDKVFVQKTKRRRSQTKITGLSASADWTDRKFNEFWKWDDVKDNWYHFDEAENTTIWYKAPPWSNP